MTISQAECRITNLALSFRNHATATRKATTVRRLRQPSPGARRSIRLLAVAATLAASFAGAARSEATLNPRSAVVREATALTSDASEDDFPAIGCDANGTLWCAWVSYDGEQDRVLASRRERSEWSQPVAMTPNAGDHWQPAVGRDGDGRFWVTWSENRNGNWDIWARFQTGNVWSEPLRLTTNAGNDFSQKLATDSDGGLWMVWQSVIERQYDIQLARLTPRGLVDSQNVSDHPASDWEPTIASGKNGRLVIAWDRYRNDSYDVLLRERVGGRLGPTLVAAGSPDYEAHAALAVDNEDRTWIAWDNGGPHWGLHSPTPQRLHTRRSVHLRCLANGRLHDPQQPLADELTGELAEFCELPELIVDGDGRLWLFVRHLEDLTPPGFRRDGRPYQCRGIWNPYAFCYGGGEWSKPVKLPDSGGRNDMRLSACLDKEGFVWASWADDARRPTRAEEPVNHNIRAARLLPPQRTPAAAILGVSNAALPSVLNDPPMIARRERHFITVGGKRYPLLFGDTHRHTDISRCGMNFDGSLRDTYRYAIDAAQLDFLAISDHDQDLLKHRYDRKTSKLLNFAWWRSQKYCDLFYIAEVFLPIYGYEHGGSMKARGGHKNVLYLHRGNSCYEEDSPVELFHLLRDKEAVVIPHQLADGGSATDWTKWNAGFERVAEIFQARGSYEYLGAPPGVRVERKGHFLWDALSGGVRIGVIASSDHGLVHRAYAGVYAEDFSRRAILDSLRHRRTFGATDTLAVEFRLGDALLGEQATIDSAPTFEVAIRGTAPIKQVQIIKDSAFVHTENPAAGDCRFQFTDLQLAPGGSAYYYLRCEQQNSEWAWSSAIWVQRR